MESVPIMVFMTNFLFSVIAGIVASVLTTLLIQPFRRAILRNQKGNDLSVLVQLLREDVLQFASRLPSINQDYLKLFSLKKQIVNSVLTLFSTGALKKNEEKVLNSIISNHFLSILDENSPHWPQGRNNELEEQQVELRNCAEKLQDIIIKLEKKC